MRTAVEDEGAGLQMTKMLTTRLSYTVVTYSVMTYGVMADNMMTVQRNNMMMMSWCLMSSDVIWHIRDKLWPMPKHGSIKSTYVRCMRV